MLAKASSNIFNIYGQTEHLFLPDFSRNVLSCSSVGSAKVLVCKVHQGNQNIVSSKEEMKTCFKPRSLGVDAINDMVTFAICTTRLPPNLPEQLFQTLPQENVIFNFVSQLIEHLLRGDGTCTS